MKETARDIWTMGCVTFSIGVAASRRARKARRRRKIRRQAGAW